MSYHTDVLLEAADLQIGENKRTLCPACRGGRSKEQSLSITLGEDAVVRYQCFRAKCDLKSGTSTKSQTVVHTQLLAKPRKTFDGVVTTLDEYYREWIMKNWGVEDPEHWWYTPEYGGRIAMSVRSPKFLHRGWVLRDISGRARTKALTYIDKDEEGLSWYKNTPRAPTVVVEDIPSAVRASNTGLVNAVALLGTGVGTSRAIEIADYARDGVIMALDQDATALSFRWARRYALLWGDVSVLPLPKDLKNMNEDELREILQ